MQLVDPSSGAVVATLSKQLEQEAPAVQRSLLAQREALRASQAADTETFSLAMGGSQRFTATRTYPGLEVSVLRRPGPGVQAASLSFASQAGSRQYALAVMPQQLDAKTLACLVMFAVLIEVKPCSLQMTSAAGGSPVAAAVGWLCRRQCSPHT